MNRTPAPRHKIYLYEQPDPLLYLRYSVGSKQRALQLQHFFKELLLLLARSAEVAPTYLPLYLDVLNAKDWRQCLSVPYGWGYARKEGDSATGLSCSAILPARYPERLFTHWDDVLLRAARQSVKPQGSLQSYLDVLLGIDVCHAWLLQHNYGHAGRPPSAALREVLACYSYQSLLSNQGHQGLLQTLESWAKVQLAATSDTLFAPEDFRYPRARLSWDTRLAAQGRLHLLSSEIRAHCGDALPLKEVAAHYNAKLKEASNAPATSTLTPLSWDEI